MGTPIRIINDKSLKNMAKVDQIFRLVRIIKELERNKENGGLTYEELRDRLEDP